MSELNKRKKLLVIGAGDFQLPLVQKASETCDVFLAAPVISEAFYPYIKGRLLKDVRDEEAILSQEEFRVKAGISTTVCETLRREGVFGDIPVSAQMSLFDF